MFWDFISKQDLQALLFAAAMLVVAVGVLAYVLASYVPKVAKAVRVGFFVFAVVMLIIAPTFISIYRTTFVFQ